ncbi:MAG: hypothetical protein SFX73_08555 [Kofleriaceae bacterium]|nr:hypothetical protein [Kofleriaceae bacterium]
MFHQDGRCASEAETIYVQRTTGCANGPAAGAGSAGAPFCTSQLGVDSVTPERRVIVLRGPDPLTGMVVGNAGGPISVFGQSNASVEPGAAGPGLRLTASEIYVRGVAIRRGSFEGVLVENGVLRMHRCRIENNAKGGVLVRGGGFDLANSIIVGNGPGETPGGAFWGGIAFTSNTASPARVANSTIVNNESAGIVCAAALQSPTGLIVFGNRNTPAQIGSTCAATVCCTGDPMLDANYRLTAGSPCIDKLPANMSTVDDIDGEPRPKGAASDCGADEF